MGCRGHQQIDAGRSSVLQSANAAGCCAWLYNHLALSANKPLEALCNTLCCDLLFLRMLFNREGEADKQDWRQLLGQADSNSKPSSHSSNAEEHSTTVPRTDAQLLKLKCAEAAHKLVREARSLKHHKQQEQKTQQEWSNSGTNERSSSSSGQQSATPVGQQVKEQLAALLALVDRDSWGTTQQSPAEIAQQIADSNRRAGRGGGGGGGARGGDDGDDDDGEGGGEGDDEPLELSPLEERYSDQAAVTAELKEMDEIYEVLAKVRR